VSEQDTVTVIHFSEIVSPSELAANLPG
jgi:hypothetical protein